MSTKTLNMSYVYSNPYSGHNQYQTDYAKKMAKEEMLRAIARTLDEREYIIWEDVTLKDGTKLLNANLTVEVPDGH